MAITIPGDREFISHYGMSLAGGLPMLSAAYLPAVLCPRPQMFNTPIQLEHDLPCPPGTNNAIFHRKQFLAERIGWAAMAFYVAWALAGGFGDGWLSRNEATNTTGTCVVEYQRFGRRDAPFELRVHAQSSEPRQQITLHFNREFMDGANIERTVPAYQKMELHPEGLKLFFAVEPEAVEYSFKIEYKPQHVGPLPVAVRPAEEAEVAFEQFVYP